MDRKYDFSLSKILIQFFIQNCWHCGRKAIETCSACNIARYCGQYCQHRDWELHQKLCGPDLKRKLNDNPQLYRRSIPKTISLNQQKDNSIITTTTQNVSSPPPVMNNDNEKSEISNEELTMIKTESS